MRCVPPLALLFLAAFTPVLHAQSTNASFTGRITDPAKAVIADVKVTAVSNGTNVRYETTTNGSGEYHLASLPPGAYRIEIEKTGFACRVRLHSAPRSNCAFRALLLSNRRRPLLPTELESFSASQM